MYLITVKEIAFAIGDFFYWTFEILPPLGNAPNLIFLIITFALFFYWMKQLAGYRKKAKESNNLKYE